jgi:hypothetical protein
VDSIEAQLNKILKTIDNDMILSLDKIGKHIKDLLTRTLETRWYSSYTPKDYIRTRQLIDSLSVSKAKKIAGMYAVHIYFDDAKIFPMDSPEPGKFPAHKNITDGQSSYQGMTYGELLPMWIEHGQHSSIHSYTGVHAVEDTRNFLIQDQYLKNNIIEYLKEAGYQVQ